jgi:hypothetical protein
LPKCYLDTMGSPSSDLSLRNKKAFVAEVKEGHRQSGAAGSDWRQTMRVKTRVIFEKEEELQDLEL